MTLATRRENLSSRIAAVSSIQPVTRISRTISRPSFQPIFFAARQDFGDRSAQPVFIIGLPRSGTTLVERIAMSHSQVASVGEVDDIENLSHDFSDGDDFPKNVRNLTQDQSMDMARSYLRLLQEKSDRSLYVINKLPQNFFFAGLIHLLFPRAKIIHSVRDVRDSGLSCYFQNFEQPHPWSCDLAHLGHYINAYQDLIEHWRAVLPVPMLDVVYEDLVADLESHSRAIIDFLDLDWEPECLDFHTYKGAVKTASKWQVRKPVHNRSVGRWRDVEAQLAPMLDILKKPRA